MNYTLPLALLLVFFSITSCRQQSAPVEKTTEVDQPKVFGEADIAEIFQNYGVHGTFAMQTKPDGNWMAYNSYRADSFYLPASTFKIPNSLIALECGVIADENEIIPWDGKKRALEAWNQDHNLQSAIKVSAVWFYQDLARRIGTERMQYWVDGIGYGNQNIGGAIDAFWLDGDLRINAREQIIFLRKLYYYDLPFSKRNMDIVKNILILEQTPNYTLCGKTGWDAHDEPNIGWFVGWLETKNRVYFFALNLDLKENKDANARRQIVTDIFTAMGLMTK